ncbi:MAG: autotransporter outer membrane beta-barrel domain-containing protein [Deltaproteobacteria bacterium]|nr:autotransporter outer membrane beta-barrel domain-containing protein [Deltaproteobacteria bacterium]
MENSKAQLFLDRNGLAIGSSVYVRNSGSLILRQDAKITGSLSVSSPKVISGSGVTTSKSIAGGIVVLGTSTLTVTGAVNFESLSTLVITRTASDTGKIVSDTSITFASQSIIQVSNQGSPGINSSNSVIATAPTINFSNVTIDGYSLQKQGNNLVIATSGGSGGTDTPGSGGTDTPGSGGTDTPGSGSGSGEIGGNTNFPESVADSVTSNPNYGAAISLVDAIVSHPSEAPVLAAQITKVISAAAEEIEDNPELQIKALAQLAGEEALSSLNASVETAQVVTNAVSSRFAVLHGYSPTAPSAGYGAALNRLWVSAYGNWTKQKNMETIEGYSYDTFGVILGYDREIASIPGLSVGISAAFTDGKLKNNTGYAKTDIKTFSVSAYGSYQFGGGFFVDGLFGFGHSTNDADILQIIGNVRKTAAYDTNSFQAALTFGHDFYLTPNIRLTPSAGVQFVNVKQDGWAESIAADPDRLALAHWFGGSRKTFVDIPLKLALAAKTETGGVVFSTEVRAGAILAAKKSDNILQMGFVGSGRSALINGIDSTKTRFTGGVSLGIQINETVDVFIDYDLETRKKYISHSAAAGIGFSF